MGARGVQGVVGARGVQAASTLLYTALYYTSLYTSLYTPLHPGYMQHLRTHAGRVTGSTGVRNERETALWALGYWHILGIRLWVTRFWLFSQRERAFSCLQNWSCRTERISNDWIAVGGFSLDTCAYSGETVTKVGCRI